MTSCRCEKDGGVDALSIIIPTFDAGLVLRTALQALQADLRRFSLSEIIVIDGGSSDETASIASECGATVLTTERGRGTQLAAGCDTARGSWLLFLHADTLLSSDWPDAVLSHMQQRDDRAGWFRFKLDDASISARIWEMGVAVRCAIFALPYGDQGLLISRQLYDCVGGFRPLPLMEDVDLILRLGRRRLKALNASATTSAKRFRQAGYLAQSIRNWMLLVRFLLGGSVHELARRYTMRIC